ncbi:anthranilate synthase component I family protein [Gluconobacter morbifer]|uniref:Aminodeoxychorismate synthase n=1 Tax=Gluconobacter morbifer G707 TaxID=1088869 RepID=G6XJD4_9PROT|nr:anthranilate synthase component I family protein [Gluconobacter morbifer]EHH68039.1 hypothetical protein GMO_18060 [Gluconobacter morbifer G707]
MIPDQEPFPLPVTEIPWSASDDLLLLLAQQPWGVCLDSGGEETDARARWSFLCLDPDETLTARGKTFLRNGRTVQGDLWWHLRDMARLASQSSWQTAASAIPFTGGIVGLFSYEAGLALEQISSRHIPAAPTLLAASFSTVLAFDRLERRCWWICGEEKPAPAIPLRGHALSGPSVRFQPDQSRDAWMEAVRQVRAFIAAGDIFQANLTMRWTAPCPPDFDELTAYQTLRMCSPAPFGAYFRTPDFSLLSASVERFISLSAPGRIETRPIKGTAPLGQTAMEQARNAALLAADDKELAENLMITDLMRNDIGRVSCLDSVTVPQLSTVERFAHVLHLVSSVEGQLRPGLDAFDLLRATLPPGSVTGAPKKRAMEIIDQLEASSRGAYCGSLFRIGHDGAMDSSVIIRSLERQGKRLSIGAGGGITWLSDPAREYDEMCLKAAPLLKVFGS